MLGSYDANLDRLKRVENEEGGAETLLAAAAAMEKGAEKLVVGVELALAERKRNKKKQVKCRSLT